MNKKQLEGVIIQNNEFMYSIREILVKIQNRLSKLEEPRSFSLDTSNVSMVLLSLPDHLRKTFLALINLKEAKAEDVANITQRARAVESNYLNQLVRLGRVRKRKEGRKRIFYL